MTTDQSPIFAIPKDITGLDLDKRKTPAMFITALCKDDKEQLNRIEEMLIKLTKSL